MKKTNFLELVKTAFYERIIKKIIFSRPVDSEIKKVYGRVCEYRGGYILQLEYFLPGNTVSHKNISPEELENTISALLSEYNQANLITTLGDAEWKVSKSGKDVILGNDKILRALGNTPDGFSRAGETLDKAKNYILRGDEEFLILLGISDKNGRVHDKKQGKFRQINRFLEHINDIYSNLPSDNELLIYDLCCGKSYLSFALYYYLTAIKCRRVRLIGIDLKRDVIKWCNDTALSLGFSGMSFIYDDVKNTPKDAECDMVISLHACDIATDIVLRCAVELNARVILSTPCCHRYLLDKLDYEPFSAITRHPHLKGKLSEILTDALRGAYLEDNGYSVKIVELTDPENTPKNTLIRAIKRDNASSTQESCKNLLKLIIKDNPEGYLSEIK